MSDLTDDDMRDAIVEDITTGMVIEPCLMPVMTLGLCSGRLRVTMILIVIKIEIIQRANSHHHSPPFSPSRTPLSDLLLKTQGSKHSVFIYLEERKCVYRYRNSLYEVSYSIRYL